MHKENDKESKEYRIPVQFGDAEVYISARESKLYHLPFLESSLKAFGEKGDKVIIIFSKKDNEEVPYLDTLDWEPIKDRFAETPTQASEAPLSPVEKSVRDKLLKSKNIILHGAPGTGKTYMARKIAKNLAGDESRVEFVQFHPSYDYTDFVEGLRPILEDESSDLKFEKKPGIFKEFVGRAREEYEEHGEHAPNYVFIIDEINRGEISKIFGELFFSIDRGYRGDEQGVSTQYANVGKKEEKFYIPKNVYVIGTMNDIDRSVDSFDFAMRRRFRFIEVTAEQTKEMLEGEVRDFGKAQEVMRELNDIISGKTHGGVGLDRSYEVGPSYFLRLAEFEDNEYVQLWDEYIGPLLREYLRGTYRENENLQKLANIYVEKAEVCEGGEENPYELLWPWCKE